MRVKHFEGMRSSHVYNVTQGLEERVFSGRYWIDAEEKLEVELSRGFKEEFWESGVFMKDHCKSML